MPELITLIEKFKNIFLVNNKRFLISYSTHFKWSRKFEFLKTNIYIFEAASSICVSPIMLGPISQDVLQVWSRLPEAIRLDPSLAVFQREYDRIQGGDRSRCAKNKIFDFDLQKKS